MKRRGGILNWLASWVWPVQLAVLTVFGGLALYACAHEAAVQQGWAEPRGGVALVGHSTLDRPIFTYSVNGAWGGNMAAHGGGATGPWDIHGDIAEVKWTLDVTDAQFAAGLREEEHSVTLPLPRRTPDQKYLHVHFDPGNRVRIAWSDGMSSPLDPDRIVPPEEQTEEARRTLEAIRQKVRESRTQW